MRRLKAFLMVAAVLAAFQQARAQTPCDSVSEIKLMPFKDEQVDDAAYNALIEAGESAIPCLIRKVTDARKMPDPRHVPRYGDEETRVGDIALFVLTDITKIDLVGMLPVRVQRNYKDEGIYAYFKFVRKKQNREWLQRRLESWYRSR
jgi:hypothetical protein